MNTDILNPLTMEVPADKENEAIVIANAIKSVEHRKAFIGAVKPNDFYYPEFRAMAWAIHKSHEENCIPDPEMVLLKSKMSPFRYPITLELINSVVDTTTEAPQGNYQSYIQKLHLDKIKSELAKSSMEGLYQACLNKSADLSYLKERVAFLNSILEKGYSAAQCDFKGMDELVPAYIQSKNSEINFRTTGFRQLDGKLTEGFKDGKITILTALPGCVAADTVLRIKRPEYAKARQYTIVQVFNKFHSSWNESGASISSLDDNNHLQYHAITDVIYSGKKLVYEITTKSGYKLRTTSDHRFKVSKHVLMDSEGFVRLDQLVCGDRVICQSKPELFYNKSQRYLRYTKEEIIVSITEIGVTDTYDITCADPYHNFLANNFVIHNCGKSSLTLSMMKNLSNKQIYTAQFALEMDSMSLVSKLAAFNTQIPISMINKHYKNLSDKDKKVLDYELKRLQVNKHIFFNDKPTQTLDQVRDQIMQLQDKLKTQYLVVPIDLFGKISNFSKSSNFASDYEKQLNKTQMMARELGVHFILVAQINRGAVNRSTKFTRPKMSDLKNSGAFEEVADLILAVHRPYYDPETAFKARLAYGDDTKMEDNLVEEDPNKNIAEVLILKQRMGQANDLVNFYFDPDTTRFCPIDKDYQDFINRSKPSYNED